MQDVLCEADQRSRNEVVRPDCKSRSSGAAPNHQCQRGCLPETVQAEHKFEQIDLFTDYAALDREMQMQLAMVRMRRKYGKNALLKGTNFLKEATGRDRNGQIGGHKA